MNRLHLLQGGLSSVSEATWTLRVRTLAVRVVLSASVPVFPLVLARVPSFPAAACACVLEDWLSVEMVLLISVHLPLQTRFHPRHVSLGSALFVCFVNRA